MATEKREPRAPLAERLYAEFYRFTFFRAVQLIESFATGKKPLGEALLPEEEAVRFSVRPGLAFPPSDLAGLGREEESGRAEMQVAFLGLLGPSGVLPQWYNELALERLREKDRALSSFLDIFHHRLVSLFYLAWKKHRWPVRYLPDAGDSLSGSLLCLMGLGTPALAGRLQFPEESLAYYAGIFSRPVPSAVAIEAAITHYSGAAAAVDQFLERRVTIDDSDRTRVGARNSRLGEDAVCGSCARDLQSAFRIRLGPVGYRAFLRFLPSGDLLRAVVLLVRYMVGVEYEFEVRVMLKREEVPPCSLGSATPSSPRLGWSTWLKGPETVHREHPYVTFQEKEL